MIERMEKKKQNCKENHDKKKKWKLLKEKERSEI